MASNLKIQSNGIRVNCQIAGPKGAPWLIFGNSHATDLSMWDAQISHFSQKFRVLTYDQRGHGNTDAPKGGYSFGELIDDLVGLMDALDITTTSYCGLSMGGATGLGLALRFPNRVSRLVVCDSPCISTPASSAQWHERVLIARSEGMNSLVDSTLVRWIPSERLEANSPHVQKLRHMILGTPVDGYIGCAIALSNHDFRTNLRALTVPVLFVVGGLDGVLPTAMREMNKEVTGSHFVEISGAGHISNMDEPDVFNLAVSDFLNLP